ncbi:hypothetical protein NKH77_33105 [Streptomyces sp. M19]
MSSRPHPDRTDDVLTLARLAARRGPVRAILGWLARRTGGVVALVAADGTALTAPTPRRSPGPGRARRTPRTPPRCWRRPGRRPSPCTAAAPRPPSSAAPARRPSTSSRST